MNTGYPTNLADKQWQVIEKVINPQERTRKHSLRDIMNAILYINKTSRHADPSCKGAPKVIEKLEHKFPRLTKILADEGRYQILYGFSSRDADLCALDFEIK